MEEVGVRDLPFLTGVSAIIAMVVNGASTTNKQSVAVEGSLKSIVLSYVPLLVFIVPKLFAVPEPTVSPMRGVPVPPDLKIGVFVTLPLLPRLDMPMYRGV